MTESDYVSKLIPTFRIHFEVRPEVWSKDKKSRIDLVLQSKDYPDIYFGIECKIPDKKKGEKIGEYIKQAIRYSQTEFEVRPNYFKRIPILITPALSVNYFIISEQSQIIDNEIWYKDRHNANHDHHTFNGLLGSFGIGEVRKFDKGTKFYRFVFSNWTLFDSRYGININNYNRYGF